MRERLPNRRLWDNFELEFAGTLVAVSLGYSPGGRLAEVFLSTRKIGTAVDTMARDTAILLSLALQHGATATEILWSWS